MVDRQYSVSNLLELVTYLCLALAAIRFGYDNGLVLVTCCGLIMVSGLIGGVFGFLLRGRKAFFKGAFLAAMIAVAYPLSFGPACWLAMRMDAMKYPTEFRYFSHFYQPVSIAIITGPKSVHDGAMGYLRLGAPADAEVAQWQRDGIVWNKPGYSFTLLWLEPLAE